jgi:phage shock protein A
MTEEKAKEEAKDIEALKAEIVALRTNNDGLRKKVKEMETSHLTLEHNANVALGEKDDIISSLARQLANIRQLIAGASLARLAEVPKSAGP